MDEGLAMENYQRLAIGQAIQALNIKITDAQRELARIVHDEMQIPQ